MRVLTVETCIECPHCKRDQMDWVCILLDDGS